MRPPLPGRVAYLVVPHLSVAVERRERQHLAAQPVIIAGASGAGAHVLDCSSEAMQGGVRSGMPLGQAERLCPEAIFLPPRLDLYRQASAALFELLSGPLPAVEQAQLGGFYLGLANLEHCDEEALALCRERSATIGQELRLATTAGVAANKFAAEAASLCIGLQRALVLSNGAEREFLAGFPVTLLPVNDDMQRRLRLFGLRKLEQFALLPPAAVLAQFGWEGQRAHLLARGQDDRPIVPNHGERCESARREFDPPLDNLETLAAVAGQLAGELSQRLAPHFLRAGQIDLLLTCADGASAAGQRLLATPTADAGYLARLAEALLRKLRPALRDRVSDLALTLGDLSAISLHQLSLWDAPQAVEAEAHLARLATRYGPACFQRSALVDPEHRLAQRRFALAGWEPDA